MTDQDHEQIADRLEDQSAALERHVRELGDEIDAAKDDWERKRADPQVPGAPAPEEDGEREPSEQQTPP